MRGRPTAGRAPDWYGGRGRCTQGSSSLAQPAIVVVGDDLPLSDKETFDGPLS